MLEQVLLISGGESLNDEDKVCKYNAGTDTNPIFLFSLLNIESPDPPEILLSNHDIVDEELELRAEKALDMPDTQTTVSVRATLAQDYVKASHEQTRFGVQLRVQAGLLYGSSLGSVRHSSMTSTCSIRVGRPWWPTWRTLAPRWRRGVRCCIVSTAPTSNSGETIDR